MIPTIHFVFSSFPKPDGLPFPLGSAFLTNRPCLQGLGEIRNRLIAHSGVNYREIDFFCTITQRHKIQAHHVIGMDFLFHGGHRGTLVSVLFSATTIP